jgi:hypothetical protein
MRATLTGTKLTLDGPTGTHTLDVREEFGGRARAKAHARGFAAANGLSAAKADAVLATAYRAARLERARERSLVEFLLAVDAAGGEEHADAETVAIVGGRSVSWVRTWAKRAEALGLIEREERLVDGRDYWSSPVGRHRVCFSLTDDGSLWLSETIVDHRDTWPWGW